MDTNEPKVEEKVVEETTQTVSPTVEAPATTEQTTTEPVPPQEETHEEPQGMTEEQRKAFQDQRLEIKRLKEEQTVREQSESAFAPFRPRQVGVIDVNRYADPTTGEVNWNAYNSAVQQSARAEASQAAEDKIDEFQARQKHPDLFDDPNSEREIADLWFAAKMRGEQVTVTSVADRVAKRYGRAVSKAEKTGAEKMLTEMTPKEQAAMAATSTTSAPARQAQTSEELEALKSRSRGHGMESIDAVATRMKNIPWE